MNSWRWLGLAVFLLGAMVLVGAARVPVLAQDKDKKDVKDKDAKDKDKKDAKDKDAKDKDAKDKDKKDVKDKDAKDKDAKDKDKKQEVKKGDEPKGDLQFLAFNADKKPFYQEQYTKTKQTMKVMGQTVEQDQEQTFLILWTPKAKDGDKWVVEQKIDGVMMNINIGGNKISYDSTLAESAQPKNPMTDFFGQLQKKSLTFKIGADLTVDKIEGRQEFIKDLGAINPQMQSLLNAILSDKALTKMAEPAWYAFPEKGKIPSDGKWSKKSELDLGPIGKYNTTFDFTHKGNEGGKDKIDIKVKVDYSAPTDKAGLPFIIQKADLKTSDGTGTAIFDRAKGRFDSTEITMKLDGTLEIEVGNMKTTVNIDQSQTAKTTTYDERSQTKFKTK